MEVRAVRRPRGKTRQQRDAEKIERRTATVRGKRGPFEEALGVYHDYHGHTAIVVVRAPHAVRFITLSGEPLRLEQKGADAFDRTWTLMEEYPVEQAAAIYCACARHTGVLVDAWTWLQQILIRAHQGETFFMKEEQTMAAPRPLRKPEFEQELTKAVGEAPAAKAKRAPAAEPVATVAPAKRTSKAIPVVAMQPPPEVKRRTRGSAKSADPAEPKASRATAASRFKELIMEGKITDDEIFATVAGEFGLGPERRSYVGWYRNDLKKNGHNPPEAIKVVKPTVAKAPKADAAPTPAKVKKAAVAAAPTAAVKRTPPKRGAAVGA